MKMLRMLMIIGCMFIQACGSAHIEYGVRSPDIDQYASGYAEVDVSSIEENDDTVAMNKKMEGYATQKLDELIMGGHKLVASSDGGVGTLAFKIDLDIRYGSRAARYWGGFGAGKGTVNSTFEVIDSLSGEVKYRATGASDLAVGAFGGSMESVIEKNIDALLDGYQG